MEKIKEEIIKIIKELDNMYILIHIKRILEKLKD